MIQLQSDYLVFKTSSGEAIPCSAEKVTLELIGDAASEIDPEIVQNASAAVLHYFKSELNRHSVSIKEFSCALARVLRDFGLDVKAPDEGADPAPLIVETDLIPLVEKTGFCFELALFEELKGLIEDQLSRSPQLLRFKGLRACVKQLSGARRWNRRCQCLHDQIVAFLRHRLAVKGSGLQCWLVVY